MQEPARQKTNLSKKLFIWLCILVFIMLGFSAMFGFVHIQGADASKNTQEKTNSLLGALNYEQSITEKIKESNLSVAASQKASYLAAFIAKHTVQKNSATNTKTHLPRKVSNFHSNNSRFNQQRNKD